MNDDTTPLARLHPAADERCAAVPCAAVGTEQVEVGGSMYRVCRDYRPLVRQGRRGVNPRVGHRTYANMRSIV